MIAFSKYGKFLWDFLCFLLAPSIAFWLRFDFNLYRVIPQYLNLLLISSVIESCLGLLFLVMYKPYKNIWSYTSIKEIQQIFKLVLMEKGLFTLIIFVSGLSGFPRSVFIVSFVVTFLMMLFPRFLERTFREKKYVSYGSSDYKNNVLIIGAGEAGEKLLREIIAHPELKYNVIGFVDDSETKLGGFIHDVKVIGKVEDIPDIAKQYKIDTIIIAIPSASGKDMSRIYSYTSKTRAKVFVVPGLYDLIGSKVSISTLRPFGLQDLLTRDPVRLDLNMARGYLGGKKVLVTGACGSIGKIICQQLISLGVELIALDNNETGIFDLEKDLSLYSKITPVIGDIRFKERLKSIFTTYKPEIVFHTAAYKHVPLMEIYPEEAILTNVVGTLNLIEVCQESRVKQMINISTDKAVDPVNVMGMTKRFTEIMSIKANGDGTQFSTVRFGNVLGSRGNVIEVWKKELEQGQPLSITSPNMKRFFMLTEEAASLVIEASCMAAPGELLVLDMGEQIPILELAKIFCETQGYQLNTDINVKYIGLRPGEKLEEKLWADNEKVDKTSHSKIMRVISPVPDLSWNEIRSIVRRMEALIREGKIERAKEELKKMTSNSKNKFLKKEEDIQPFPKMMEEGKRFNP